MRRAFVFSLLGVVLALATASTQGRLQPDWTSLQDETMRHFQALLRFDTTDPPGGEEAAAMYLKDVLEKEAIPVQTFTLEPKRTNVVARLKGNGRRRPLLIMAHTDTVNVDPAKWTFPPFSATRDGGYVYSRGTLDDKDNVAAALMTMLMLKRQNVPLDRDVIFLAEAGEEGTTRVGIQFMVNQHFSEIDAEYCLAEGGNVTRIGGEVKFASVQTLEKIPRGIQLTARGVAGHGSVPLKSNAIVHLATAIAAVDSWRGPLRVNETTAAYFKRLASISSPVESKQYLGALSLDPKVLAASYDYFLEHEPRHASMLRSSISPNIIQAGYRSNVIPSEAKVTLDVRLLPDEDQDKFLEDVRRIVNDPAIEVSYTGAATRPKGAPANLESEAFRTIEAEVKRHYNTVTLPTMSTGATDMAYLRGKGMQYYGIGPASDFEDAAKGFKDRIAIRSAFSRASCTASSASTGTSSWPSPRRVDGGPTILITGAAGNMGGFLARRLASHRLRLMYHRTPLAADLAAAANVTAVRGDLSAPTTLPAAVEKVDVIVHFAGVLFRPRPERFLPITNTVYFSNLVEAALAAKVSRIILISFPQVEGPTSFEHPATGRLDRRPISVHARTRLEEERLLMERTNGTVTTPVVLRLGTVYGRGILMVEAARWLARHRLLAVWREPTFMQMLSTEDYLRATEAAIFKPGVHGIYHVGDEQPVTLQHLLDSACRVWGYRRPMRVPLWLVYLTAVLCEVTASVTGARAPFTRDFITLGRVSHWGDTRRAREELISELAYRTLESGLSTL